MLIRYTGSTGLAGLATLGLFFVMQSLITVNEVKLLPPTDVIEIPVAERPEIVIETKEPLVPPVPATPPPLNIEDRISEPVIFDGTGIAFAPPTFEHKNECCTLIASRQPVPRFTLAPAYPDRARQMGLEGYADVAFDISPRGIPVNLRILESSNRLFESAALRAVARWRYEPAIVANEPVVFHGMIKRIRFTLEG